MKLKIIAAALLSLTLITGAFAAKPTPVMREIAITASFNKIVVDDNLNVVILQDDSKSSITVSGDEKSVQCVETAIVKGQLKISTKKRFQGKKITVYIPVKDLSIIELLNGSSISGQGMLKFPDLTVVINNECRLALNTLGKITIQSSDDCDFVYEKNERYIVLPATL